MDRGQVAGARSAVNTPLLPAPAAPAALAVICPRCHLPRLNLNVWPPSSVYGGVGLGNNPMAGES